MIPRDVANDEILDYTKTLEFIAGHLMAPGCRIVLSPGQFEVLKAYLAHIESVGDVNFQLEMCVDYRDQPSTGGYSVGWDNDGTDWQDDFIGTVMEQMTQNLGFRAGSIIREGHLIDLADIDPQIEEIKKRVTERSKQRAVDSIVSTDVERTFKPNASRSPGQPYGELTDLKKHYIRTANLGGASYQWIADYLNLPLEVVEQVIRDNGT